MEWLKSLYGTIVGLDTAPVIYFIEKHPNNLPLVYHSSKLSSAAMFKRSRRHSRLRRCSFIRFVLATAT